MGNKKFKPLYEKAKALTLVHSAKFLSEYYFACKLVYKTKMDINNNFMLMAKKMAKKGSFAGYATHDQELIDELLDWIQTERIPSEQFEFQTLYGVPMEGRLENLIRNGYRVRIYVPFGPDWFDYSVRRLKENPNIAKYVLKNFFKR